MATTTIMLVVATMIDDHDDDYSDDHDNYGGNSHNGSGGHSDDRFEIF